MDTQPHNLSIAFYNLYRDITIYRRRLTEEEIPSSENGMLRLLDVLYAQKNCSLKKLCKVLGITTPTGSVMVEKGVKRGLINRQADPKDRRKVLLTLTEEGTAFIENELNTQFEKLDSAFQNLSASDQRKLMTNIQSIENILNKIRLTPEE